MLLLRVIWAVVRTLFSKKADLVASNGLIRCRNEPVEDLIDDPIGQGVDAMGNYYHVRLTESGVAPWLEYYEIVRHGNTGVAVIAKVANSAIICSGVQMGDPCLPEGFGAFGITYDVWQRKLPLLVDHLRLEDSGTIRSGR